MSIQDFKEYQRYIVLSFGLIFREIYECHNKTDFNSVLSRQLCYKYYGFYNKPDNYQFLDNYFKSKGNNDFKYLEKKFNDYFINNENCIEMDYMYDDTDIYDLMVFINLLRDYFLNLLQKIGTRNKFQIDNLLGEIKKLFDGLDINFEKNNYTDICNKILDIHIFYFVGNYLFDKFRSDYTSKYNFCGVYNSLIYNEELSELEIEFLKKTNTYRKSRLINAILRQKYNIQKESQTLAPPSIDIIKSQINQKKIREEEIFKDEIGIMTIYTLEPINKVSFDIFSDYINDYYSQYYLNDLEICFELEQQLKLLECLSKDNDDIGIRFNPNIDKKELYLFVKRWYDIDIRNKDFFEIFEKINKNKEEIKKIQETADITFEQQIRIYQLKLDILLNQRRKLRYKLFYLDVEYIDKKKGEEYDRICKIIEDELETIALNIQLYYYGIKKTDIFTDCHNYDNLKSIILGHTKDKIKKLEEKEIELKKQIEVFNQEKTRLEEKISEKNDEIIRLNISIDKINDEIKRMRRQYSIGRKKIVSPQLKDNINKKSIEYFEMNGKLEILKEEISQIKKSLDDINKNEEQINEDKNKLQEINDEIEELKREFKYVNQIKSSIGGKKFIKKVRHIRKYKLISRT